MSEPREWWIDPVSIGRSIGNKCNLYSAADYRSDRAWVHVIDKSAYDKLAAENQQLYLAVSMTDLELAKRLKEAEAAIRDMLSCLTEDDWHCDRCGADQKAGKSNAAYYARDYLAKWEGK